MADTRPVRSGEELDIPALTQFLQERGLPAVTAVEQFPGGYSNLTYLVRAGERQLVLRRPPRGANIKSAHDMGREYRLLSALHPVYPKVPEPIAMCEDDSVQGSPFYVMERVEGLILRGKGGPQCTPEVMQHLSLALVDLLADLHSLDYAKAGLAALGKPEGYVGRQVKGWSERWGKAQTDPSPVADEVMAFLAKEQPPEVGASLIHNDFKYDNLVLSPEPPHDVLAVLDWEMATIGDPLMDLATTLGYWIEPNDPPQIQALAFGPTFLPGNISRAELAERYARRRGIEVADFSYYYAFGLFKIAVIAQQIYARYRQGLTQDPRFAHLDKAVAAVLGMARRAAETRSL